MKRKSLRGPEVQQDIEKRKDASIDKGYTQAEPLRKHFEETETDTESECSDESGFQYVRPTYRDEDAHHPESHTSEDSTEGITERQADVEKVIQVGMDDYQIDDQREETARKVVEDIVEDVDVDTVHTVEKVEEINTDAETTRKVNTDTRITDGTNSLDRNRESTKSSQNINISEKADKTESDVTKQYQPPINDKSQREGRPPPKPPERRSVRERKQPAWFDSYQMNQMVARPYDNKLMALDELMNSGILNRVNADVAHKLILAVMKE